MDIEAKQTMMGTEKEHTPLNAVRRTPNAEGAARLQPSALIVQRSEEEHTPQLVQLGDLTIDLERYRITRTDGSTIPLSEQEQLLLRTLIAADGRVVTKEQLGRLAWGWERGYSDTAIWTCVFDLRRKLGDDSRRPRYILLVRRVGYRINLPAPTAPKDTPEATRSAP